MAQKKQQFRFRIPWLSSGAPAARPATQSLSRRPKDRSKSPTQPDTSVPIQRPTSSRPPSPWIAPPQPPPSPSPTQTQGAPRAEPQQHSPSTPSQPATSSVIIDSSLTSQSEPPSRSTTPTLINSPLPSPIPSRTTQAQASSLSPSPSHAGSPSRVSIVFSSSPKTQPQSPSHLASDRPIEVPKPAAEESTGTGTGPASSTSEQEKEKMVVSEPMPQEAEPEPEPKVNSPLKATPKSPETTFQPERMSTQPTGSEPQASSVPSSPISKTEPASQPQSSSPLASERISEVLKPTTEESTLPASPVSQQEKGKVAVSEPVPQESEPKMKSPLKIIPKSPDTSSQPEKMSTQLGDEERSTTPKTKMLELDSATGNSKAPLETQSKFLQSEEKGKVVHETNKEGKAKDTITGQPIRQTKTELHTTASASGTQTKDPFTRAFRADKKQHGAGETVERKMMFATSNPSGKDIRVGSAYPETRNVSSISPEKSVSCSSNGDQAPLQKGIKEDISKFVHKLATVHPTQPMDDDDKKVSVITLAGDNRGATMHIGSESGRKEGSIHIHRAYETDPEESTEVTTDGEENSKKRSDNSTKKDEVGKAYVNSNIQSINNSMMFHGSITERDPGVQVTLPQKPAEPIKPDDDKRGLETRKAEFNISRAEKLTYQPTVRRRCLRGLFLEPSDPDPDNPDKPRRHGCKFSCGQIKKDEDIEIL